MPPEDTAAAPDGPAGIITATTPLPELRRVVAVHQIDRGVGPAIAPGQAVYLPAKQAQAEIDAGNAVDPSAPPRAALPAVIAPPAAERQSPADTPPAAKPVRI